MTIHDDPEPPQDFLVDRDTLAFIVLKAKAFDELTASNDTTDGSDAPDDRFVDALEDESDNPAERELRAAIASLDVDRRATIVALAWLGRGDYDADDWDEALSTAKERAEGSTARYLSGMPLLGDLIEAGADKLGISLTDDYEEGLGDPDLETRGT